MIAKGLGALLILGSCGGFGWYLGHGIARQEQLLRQLSGALRMMQWELKYRLTALPELLELAAGECGGELRQFFRDLARELNRREAADAALCVHACLRNARELPAPVRSLLRQLGSSLGRFDLEGQLQGLEEVRCACAQASRELAIQKRERIRSCRTLGLCTGAALVILLV